MQRGLTMEWLVTAKEKLCQYPVTRLPPIIIMAVMHSSAAPVGCEQRPEWTAWVRRPHQDPQPVGG